MHTFRHPQDDRPQFVDPWELWQILRGGDYHRQWMRRYWDGSRFRYKMGPVVPRWEG